MKNTPKEVIEAWVSGFHKEDAGQLTSLFSEEATFYDPRYQIKRNVEMDL